MTPGIWDASQTRRTYDHRLREHVVRCGTMAVAKHVQIPRSTVSTWRRRGLRPVVRTEPFDQEKQNALDSSARWEKRARVLAAVVHNTKMPHPAFNGQTPDEMFFGTGAQVPEELALAKGHARAARMAANRTMSCERCLGQQVSLPGEQIPH
jgi:hypothetical protein